jgi:lipid II:glycine glycyltransferase (peptidoglycan interpeptide bridge formation enzyme)
MSNQIKYIEHADIDSEKWAACIEKAENSRFYANIWHLDRTAIVWDALVLGDYEFVMPLPIRQKLGFTYVYQPLYCQQLGIYPEPTNATAELFYNALFAKFKYVDIHLNSQNPSVQKNLEIEFLPRHNFLLDLQYNYKSLAKSYSTNTKRNIAKAGKSNLQYIGGLRLEEYLAFKEANQKAKLSKQDIEKLKSVIAYGQYKGLGEIYGVYNAENELCAAVYFCRWKNRVIYLNAASNGEGKKLRAMYFLIDNFIRENAERGLKLDFEGSMIPGVARLYSGFGAIPETYFQLKINRLPLWLKWLKRN